MDNGADARSGLAAALRRDATFRTELWRLRRALADLAPYDDRGVRLLMLGSEVGVPLLVEHGRLAEAHSVLIDQGGCDPGAAAWVVNAWAFALGREEAEVRGVSAGGATGRVAAPEHEVPAERPGAPTSIRLAVWPDGMPALAVLTQGGAFVAVIDPGSATRPVWRLFAAPATPLSRDVALVLHEERGALVWSDAEGIRARSLFRTGGRPRLSDPRRVAEAEEGEQPRYPLTALMPDAATLDVLWTAENRSRARRTTERGWGTAAPPVWLPSAGAPGERLAGLDAAIETARTAWLVCRTDRSRVFAAEWELATDQHGPWLPLALPFPYAAAVAVVASPAGPVVFAATVGGRLISADARRATDLAAWYNVEWPDEVGTPSVVHGIAAGAAGGHGWLAVTGDMGTWIMPLDLRAEIPACGPATAVWTGS